DLPAEPGSRRGRRLARFHARYAGIKAGSGVSHSQVLLERLVRMGDGMYTFLADAIVAVHLVYVGYVVLGQLAIMAGVLMKWHWIRNPAFRWSHLAMICIVAAEAIVNFECPLTTWERHLRKVEWQE